MHLSIAAPEGADKENQDTNRQPAPFPRALLPYVPRADEPPVPTLLLPSIVHTHRWAMQETAKLLAGKNAEPVDAGRLSVVRSAPLNDSIPSRACL